ADLPGAYRQRLDRHAPAQPARGHGRLMQLFCLAHAGASAMPYARWRKRLPRWLEVCPLELPGRGAREGEPLCKELPALLADLKRAWLRECSGPYLLWGHSLGAMLAFELAQTL